MSVEDLLVLEEKSTGRTVDTGRELLVPVVEMSGLHVGLVALEGVEAVLASAVDTKILEVLVVVVKPVVGCPTRFALCQALFLNMNNWFLKANLATKQKRIYWTLD